ncbi:MAG: NUDIX domain-containing protein [Ginsengibacter sp.]
MDHEIKNLHIRKLCGNWSQLKNVSFDYFNQNGEWEHHEREVYDRGNGAVIMLYNKSNNKVILTRQLRIPTYLNGNESGMMIEACAGLLDDESPEHGIRRETEEETGYRIQNIQKVFEAYTSPGSVTEILNFFIAEYSSEMKVNEGGGAADEHENIEVIEMHFKEAVAMIERGEIKDAKTIMLLQYLQIHNLVI